MTPFTLSISGDKRGATQQAIMQIPHGQTRDWVIQLIEDAPGTHVSISGTLTASSDGSHGSISLSGSFWTS